MGDSTRQFEPGSPEWEDHAWSLLLDEATTGADRWWWLSFADATLPKGTQFLGACIVRARGMVSAVSRAHVLGINPGGEVVGYELPAAADEIGIPDDYCNRLLTREEAERGPFA